MCTKKQNNKKALKKYMYVYTISIYIIKSCILVYCS